MQKGTNRRGHNEGFCDGEHLKLWELQWKAQRAELSNQYLDKNYIPEYPRPEFHVIRLKHDTTNEGLRGIREDEGFKAPTDRPDPGPGLVWFSLDVGPEEVRSAETRLLEKTFPDRTKEQADTQQSFLWRFATSPAFKETSRLGSYRFTFPLEDVLENYRDQFCSGQQPVMRVFRTSLYKQEVQYSVLVHSPDNGQQFYEYPLLSDHPNAVCFYKDGRFIWRCQAMCETHRCKLIKRPDENQLKTEDLPPNKTEYYVWDNVAIALHVDKEVLKFGADRLRKNLRFCEEDKVQVDKKMKFQNHTEDLVNKLWPDSDMKLKKETSLEQSFTEAAGGRPVKLEEDMEYM